MIPNRCFFVYLQPLEFSIGGVPVIHPADRADLIRLDVLLQDGGIYITRVDTNFTVMVRKYFGSGVPS